MKLGNVSWAAIKQIMRVHPAGPPGEATAEDIAALNAHYLAGEFDAAQAITDRLCKEIRQARNARKRARASKVVPSGRILEARRAVYHERIREARDLRRVIRKAAKGEPIPKRLVPQVERMRALSGASQADRDAATFVPGWRRAR